ncbi:hypothetical protein B1757_10340 [Acidithiobacillus marinus]|uniref:Uncharacterized protein n=1 Tax=Acidithiobacillus marinus TaxID=187490 RepID=A0A2I1DK98_9PROT|nr:hypothetical protein [Acidithiobacillus marinus]PKY10317.1 hypothetical protein B1757_10340 [Acidithiobacillus marinus]
MKTLYLHAGGSKTGSSALQVFFSQYARALEQQGIAYKNNSEVRHEYQITSGNGYALFELLVSASSNDCINEIIMSYFGTCNCAIISSEYMQHLDAKQVYRLMSATFNLGIQLELIYFVRSVIPFVCSAYDQVIKRHGEWRSIDDWIPDLSTLDHIEFLKRVSGIIPSTNIHVFNYDSISEHLVDTVLQVLKIVDKIKTDVRHKQRRVNRSLTNQERNYLRDFNRRYGGQFSQEVSDRLIYIKPEYCSETPRISDHSVSILEEKFQADIAWVNQTFLGEKDGISIYSSHSAMRGIHRGIISANELEQNEIHNFVLEWSIERIKSLQKELDDVYRSRSFRLTYPLRRIWRLIHCINIVQRKKKYEGKLPECQTAPEIDHFQ